MIKWIKSLFQPAPIPDRFIIEDKILPGFPSYKASDKDIWNILNKNKILIRLCGDRRPSSEIGKLYHACHKLDLRKDSEYYPTWSNIKITINLIKE